MFLLLTKSLLWGQRTNIGSLPTINFTKNRYKGGTQSWCISQDAQGGMWFANNGGLLNYDGRHWKVYPMSNNTIIRSLAVDHIQHKIYIGGQGEFGYFYSDGWGKLQFFSLSHSLPKEAQQFSDVWDINIVHNDVFFRTDNQIFIYRNNQVTPLFSTPTQFLFSGILNGKLLFQDKEFKLFQFDGTSVIPSNINIKGQISDIISFTSDSTLISTLKNGFFIYKNNTLQTWHTQADDFLKKNVVLCAQKTPNNNLVIGTALNGLVILDENRQITQHFNNQKGLQNNTILCLSVTQNGSVWTGSDNGIDYVDISSAFSTIYPDDDLEGTGYCASIFQNKIYFGTNTGLYVADWKKYYSPLGEKKFTRVNNSDGQVWSLNILDNQLLMGHHDGAFTINGNIANRITPLQGIWKFIQLSPNSAIAGFYKGIALLKKNGNHWGFDGVLDGLTESSRLLGLDNNGTVWMAHPYRGIYKIELNAESKKLNAEFLGEKNGLPSDLGNHLFQLKSKIIFSSKKGLFEYNKNGNYFRPNNDFDSYFGKNATIKFLKQDDYGNIWYGTNKETGILQIQDYTFNKQITKITIPELHNKLVEGFQFVYPIDNNNAFFATERGFMHFNLAKYLESSNTKLRLLLSEIRLVKNNDSLIYDGFTKLSSIKPIELNHSKNSLYFSFAAPDYPESDCILYSHYLKGLENDWSEWKNDATTTYIGLKPGKYTFYVKAKDKIGKESDAIEFSFTIEAPWYASNTAYFFYILVIIGAIWALMRRQEEKFKSEKKVLQAIHKQKEAEHLHKEILSEASINRLQDEKFEAELQHKNQELLSLTMHIAQKNEMLKNIRIALDKLGKKVSDDVDIQREIEHIIKIVQQDANIEADWDRFIYSFDILHDSFYKRLKEYYPTLSPTDYRLCVYLRMNLSSKDIATLLNISLRSVETNRYRLRKKLELPNEVNLSDFLINF